MEIERFSDHITLYQGDCFEILPEIKDCDACITDPPYGCTTCKWDKSIDLNLFWPKVVASCKKNVPFILFSDIRFAVNLITTCKVKFRYDLVWAKNIPVGFLNANKLPLRKHELILVFYNGKSGEIYHPQKVKGIPYKAAKTTATPIYHAKSGWMQTVYDGWRYPTSVLEFDKPQKERIHPTQKPIPLMEWLVKTYSNEGDTIIDPFMGSGSTCIAAILNHRKFIGIEKDKENFSRACVFIENTLKSIHNIDFIDDVINKTVNKNSFTQLTLLEQC